MINMVDDSKSEPLNNLNREEKLKWLMKTHGNDVIRIAYTYLKQKQLAEDVAQDVFIKCYEKMDSFRNESSYKTWLIRITVNKCKDVLKSWSFKNLYITDFFSSKQAYSTLEQQYFSNEENELISKQVIALPVKLREVIILFYYQEFSIEEISDLLKINPNTVKTRLHRGRLKLKESLGAWSFNAE
ncbi:RNA polymerase sigma-70 factor (ECF subfamily) [Cytobacillus oceanisediminis]|uniref:RNA polymerase sigma-70 factor (ECF subfamily) n=1 Tax=Cytobacillus oceanisediminis TaxID=665099 RepID=A0A2V3A3T7_9BACI|nr:sigma-70 family RNA polymerase sigma factor [Cytobacillus oceanisediminis]PWW30570.1 RNA polymerase sigma-70 factor (ECF subfamily) [Cytobacillus oceanisediminis]